MGEPVIIVTGTPGAGKTSISLILSGLFSCAYVDSSEAFRAAGATVSDPTGRYTEVIDEDRARGVVVDTVVRVRGCVVVDTVYPSIWLEYLEEYTALIVLVRCNPRELCKRLYSRGWPPGKVLENCEAEAVGSIAWEVSPWSHMVIEVDTTGRSPGESVDLALDKLYSWSTGIYIDWLSIDEGVVEYLSRLPRIDPNKYRGPQ